MDKINQIRLDKHNFLQSMTGIDNMPEIFYCMGNLPAARQPTVAIIGTRKPTSYGREVTYNIAAELARHGVVIVSGLALGVDSIAHQATIDAGGTTIAVQANGLHRIYPSTNRQLAADIITHRGAIISEYKPGTEPMQYRFLERNRLVSALADIIVITEAAARSGTMNTAASALAQGKELMVVPGNITSAMSSGCNRLLRQGAAPITSVKDILDLLPIGGGAVTTTLALGSNPLEQQVIDALHSGLRDGDEIYQSLGDVSPAAFSTALTMLEIQGVIKPLGANQWRLN